MAGVVRPNAISFVLSRMSAAESVRDPSCAKKSVETYGAPVTTSGDNVVAEVGQFARDRVELLPFVERLAVLHYLPSRRRTFRRHGGERAGQATKSETQNRTDGVMAIY